MLIKRKISSEVTSRIFFFLTTLEKRKASKAILSQRNQTAEKYIHTLFLMVFPDFFFFFLLLNVVPVFLNVFAISVLLFLLREYHMKI